MFSTQTLYPPPIRHTQTHPHYGSLTPAQALAHTHTHAHTQSTPTPELSAGLSIHQSSLPSSRNMLGGCSWWMPWFSTGRMELPLLQPARNYVFVVVSPLILLNHVIYLGQIEFKFYMINIYHHAATKKCSDVLK